MNTGYVNAIESLFLISFILQMYIPSINRHKENTEKSSKEKIPASTYIALYLRDTFPLNNLISHFHSPSKFLLILWGLTWWLLPPRSSLSISSNLCVTFLLRFLSILHISNVSLLLVFSLCICPIPLCSTSLSYIACSYVLPMCNALALQRTRISLAQHHVPLHQDSSWHNKCLLNERMNDKN